MKFWPLAITILGTGYFAAWRYYWYVPTGITVATGLLLWCTGHGALAIALGCAAAAVLSPLAWALCLLMFVGLH